MVAGWRFPPPRQPSPLRILMKFADFFEEPEVGRGNVSVWRHNDGSYFVIEVVRFAAEDKEGARHYAAILAGDENQVLFNAFRTLH